MAMTVALDIGGTFTDLVAYDSDTGRLSHSKAATTPSRLIDGIQQCLAKADIAARDVRDFVHGSTIAINTVLERNGAKTALVVTEGMRDVYAIGRQNRPDAYNVYFRRPQPLVARRDTFEVAGRLAADGTVVRECDDQAVAAVVEQVHRSEAEAVAVCLLHSYANIAHEAKLAGALKAALPGAYVTSSHEIVREYREYERISSTVLNAYIGPRVAVYLADLEQVLTGQGFAGRLFIMQSNGGVMSPGAARTVPVAMMESGPVGGIVAAASLGRDLDLPNIIAFDMGGTTAKASLVTDFQPTVTHGYYIGGYATGQPLLLPVVDVVEVGTGGGSIAELDDVGALRVGPSSAGGHPGPVCYGWGGRRPTVTDANLVLGRLSPDRFLGGEMPLDATAAAAAIAADVAGPLGLSVADAAHGIVDLAMASMALAVRAVSVERGHDPRDFTMIAFGGAGPLHACAIARELHIPAVVVPVLPAHFSALGMAGSSYRHDLARTVYESLDDADLGQLVAVADELRRTGLARLAADGVPEPAASIDLALDLRYQGQEFPLTTPVSREMLVGGDRKTISQRFAELHHLRYRHSAPTEAVELINVRLVAQAARAKPALTVAEGPGAGAPRTRRVVLSRGREPVEVPVYQREDLRTSDVITGPAVVEEYASTTVIWPGDRLRRLPGGDLHIRIGND